MSTVLRYYRRTEKHNMQTMGFCVKDRLGLTWKVVYSIHYKQIPKTFGHLLLTFEDNFLLPTFKDKFCLNTESYTSTLYLAYGVLASIMKSTLLLMNLGCK